jgi:hypothetical protein
MASGGLPFRSGSLGLNCRTGNFRGGGRDDGAAQRDRVSV